MLIDNLALYEDKYYVRVNEEGDGLFYFLITTCVPRTSICSSSIFIPFMNCV